MKLKKNIFLFLSILIIASGIFFRFWQLGSVPPGVQYDEAYNGLNALEALKTGDYKIFYTENYGREGFHINVTAFFVKFFGPISLSLRVANAIWGSLTLIGFYLLLRQLKFSRLSVLLGTFMLTYSFWHLDFSRTAYRAIMVPLLLSWIFYFFFKAIDSEKNRKYYFAISGILFGLGFHTYIAFRIVPVILASVALAVILTKKGFLKKNWKSAVIFSAVSLAVALPIFVYYSGHMKDFMSRSEAVSIFNTPKMSPGTAFVTSLSTHINAFFVSGDRNPRHNYHSQPLLPAAWSVLFALGFFISLSEIAATALNLIKNKFKKSEHIENPATKWFYVSVLAQSIFWCMLVPGILSIEGIPHSLRIIGVIPAVFLFAVLPFEYIFSLYEHFQATDDKTDKNWKLNKFSVLVYGIIIMVAYGGFIQVYTYFGIWSKDLATYGGYERKLYDLGNLIGKTPLHKNNYLITAYNAWISSDGKQTSLKTTEYIGYPNSQQFSFYKPMDGVNNISCEDPLLIFQESDQWLRDQYKNKCPNLAQQRYAYDNGKYMFWVMANK
jgi:4-amino-4-deoxy-L-arabinose transferase-like glycosyltransferase